jgi:hypothetical protein
MATTAQYVSTPVIEVSQVTTADTSRTAPSTTTLICAGPSSVSAAGIGKRILRITICGTATTLANAVRIFISTDGGTTKRLLVERVIPAITATAGTTPPFRAEVPELVGLVLPGTVSSNATNLYASTNISETFNIVVESGTL